MFKQLLKTKIAPALVMVAVVGSAGGVATASAHHGESDHRPPHGYGYDKDQCKDGGWKNFKNPDGSPKFKNQGQCVAFFSRDNDDRDDHDGHHDNDHHGDQHDKNDKHDQHNNHDNDQD